MDMYVDHRSEEGRCVFIFEFQSQFKKNNSLESHIKLETGVNEVFFYQNTYFFHAKINRRHYRRRRRQ